MNASEEPEGGAPWKHDLTIDSLGKDDLEASAALSGAKWIWPTVMATSSLATGLALLAVHLGKSGNRPGMFVFMALAVLVSGLDLLVLGCISYVVRLSIDESSIRFQKRFMWMPWTTEADRGRLDYVKCWSDVGEGGAAPCYLVCLHFRESIPPLCVHQQGYTEDANDGDDDLPTQEKALENARAKADEIAAYLSVDSR